MANIEQWISADLTAVHIAYRGVGGYMAGAAKLLTSDTGESSGMHLLDGATDIPIAVSGAQYVNIPGNGGIIARLPRKSTDVPTFVVTVSPRDIAAENMCQDRSKYAVGEWDKVGIGGAKRLSDMILLAHRGGASWEPSSRNSPGYENLLIPSLYLDPAGDQGFANQREGASRFNGTTNGVTKLPTGVSVLTAFGDPVVEAVSWFSDYPTMFEVFVGDGTIDDIPLTYAPISTAKTKAFLFSDGSTLTVSSVNTSSKLATLSAAPASGAIVVVEYETSDIA